jgi:hypothetical protein
MNSQKDMKIALGRKLRNEWGFEKHVMLMCDFWGAVRLLSLETHWKNGTVAKKDGYLTG